MVNLDNISFPYPVLGLGDDVEPSPKLHQPRLTKTADEFVFDVKIEMDNQDILRYIAEGYAEFVCEVDCQKTFFRKCFTSKTSDLHIVIPRYDVQGKITFKCTIPVKKNISNYVNSGFHQDYKGFQFNLVQGDLLAYLGAFEYDAEINYSKLQSIGTFMEIKQGPDDNKFVQYDLDSDKIVILLPPGQFNLYRCHIFNDISKANIIHSSMVFNALTYALFNYEEHKERLWARTLEYRITREPDFVNYSIDEPDHAIFIAQALLKNPYGRMFDCLVNMNGNNEEE